MEELSKTSLQSTTQEFPAATPTTPTTLAAKTLATTTPAVTNKTKIMDSLRARIQVEHIQK